MTISTSCFRRVVVVLALSVWVIPAGLAAQSVSAGTQDGEWPVYHGNLAQQHYSPLDQISAANFHDLEVAWTFKTDNLGTRPEFKLVGTPLMVGGRLYATGGTRRSVVAVDAATGELLWVHGEKEGARGAASPRQLSGRGLAYWNDGVDERILYVTPGFRLVALDAGTGMRIADFGDGGLIDLKEAAVYGDEQPIDPVTGEIGLHATPTVARDIVIVGSSMREGHTPRTHNNTKGLIQAFDVRTGERRWIFHTIPRPGEFGSETWQNGSWAVNGNVGVWNQIAADEELGLIYLPVETPTSDFYGGHRPGDNLFAESLVALDLETGKRRWHFQLVHHPIWNMDISTAPILEDITVDGRQIKAVSIMGKQTMVYTFDRVTGEPVWPIEERPVPQSDVPGEQTSPTQPFPTKPPPYDHNGVTVDGLIDFTTELRAEAEQLMLRYRTGPVFTPPVVSDLDGAITAFRSSGGTNWPGGAYDPETQTLFAPSYTSMVTIGLLPPPNPEFSDIRYVRGNVLTGVRYVPTGGDTTGADTPERPALRPYGGTGARTATPNPRGLPFLKPPYGKLTAIDMSRGDILWQIPHGETPDRIKNHPALAGLDIARTGQAGAVGALVTKTLVIMGEPTATTTSTGARGAMLRAYDKRTGEEVGAVYMPAQQSGSPMTYMVDGVQYIVVAISGGVYSGEYRAFRLPS
ncbi:MAG TPA: PQQ-binding-like beta-propeller repeat protein [Vicinamibacterales bacterium]|nr:PQQ-binding-like beta-propeller repeat protein [Vicinamibacterales bacterium]